VTLQKTHIEKSTNKSVDLPDLISPPPISAEGDKSGISAYRRERWETGREISVDKVFPNAKPDESSHRNERRFQKVSFTSAMSRFLLTLVGLR